MRFALLALLVSLPPVAALPAQTAPAHDSAALPSIASKTSGMKKFDGLLPLYWDSTSGHVWLEIPRFDQELLYVVSLPAGLGSNDIGLDRGQLGSQRLVRFERVGPKVLMVQPNLEYRALSPNPDERAAVRQSFAQSVIWGFTVAAETDGRVLVDATDFAVRDAHDVVGALKRSDQGDFALDQSRSAVYLARTGAFPQNSDIEVTLTFTGKNPGSWVRNVAPDPDALTVREHHSFIALPDSATYHPRLNQPGSSYFGVDYADYAAPLGQPVMRHYIARHRLEKKDPGAAMSDPVKPIIYYLDRGVPEPVRSALLEGANWWNQAFEAAGYRNAFKVELLPEGVDPLDVRYNVIEWVHRATRGWSYGDAIVDPRTGEIINGHVLLGSLRVRQDYLLAEGLLSPYTAGSDSAPRAEAMALARIRQLAAHEVGHSLGLMHNYISSAEGRASVMDYPEPLVKLAADGAIDLSDAYATGIGAWDKVSIQYGYGYIPPQANERAVLDSILAAARSHGLTFLTDQDARPTGSVHPQTHLWDNGVNAAAELERIMKVRRAALERFGEGAIRTGMPLATIEEALVPIYLFHRYQAEAAVKSLGGEYYSYALKGDGQQPVRAVPAAEQQRALAALMTTVDPAALALPDTLLHLIPPRPYLYPMHRELFTRYTGMAFDAVSPAVSAADMTFSLILQPERAARLVEQHALSPALPGLDTVLAQVTATVFGRRMGPAYQAEIARAVAGDWVQRLMDLASTAEMPAVRAASELELERIRQRMETVAHTARGAQLAEALMLAGDIERFQNRPEDRKTDKPAPEPPPGSPIGN